MFDAKHRLEAYASLLERHPRLATNAEAPFRLILARTEMERFEQETGLPLGVVAEDPYVLVLHDLVENRAGRRFLYIRILNRKALTAGHGAIVLPVARREPDAPDAVLLIRTYRHALRSWVLELPRGAAEPGATGHENAQRELLEETGFTALSFEQLGTVEPDSGLMSSPADVYLAVINPALTAPARPETAEAIDGVVLLTLPDLESAIARGEIRDGFSLAAVALALANGALSFDRPT